MFVKLFGRERSYWKGLLLFVLIAALTYLPSALRLTYYRDDWYYAYDALVGPVGVFRAMFAIDRPARGPFFEGLYALFGMAPLAYHLAMFFWRLIGGLGVVWLFHLLWPRHREAGLAAGLLFALYPGFTWWVSGIEYQPMVASAALMVWSLGLTLQALRMEHSIGQTLCVAAAIATGWIYLSFVDYAAGIEALRFLLIYVVIRPKQARSASQRALVALRRWFIYLIIPAGFLVWRFLFFSSQRKATDLGAQLGGFLADPITTGLHWLVNFLLSLINVALSAWVAPLTSNFFANSLREVLLGLFLALVAGFVAWLMLASPIEARDVKRRPEKESWPIQPLWLGAAGLVLGILPVIAVNRQITFPNFSHYALPASLGLMFVVVGLAYSISDPRIQTGVLSGLILLCALTHQGLGANALHEERIVSNFWQQMAWRAPSLAPGTTLLAYYPGIDYADDTDIVWVPADYIYYPQRQAAFPIRAFVSALPPDRLTFNNILLGRDPQESPYRAHTMTLNYDQVLILSQPAEDACVHVIDVRWPMLSLADDPVLHALAPFSRVDNLHPSGGAPKPPAFLFGPEPKHGWCYYFERASLASQQGNWSEVARLQEEIAKLGLHPNDQIEWMPFLQAQAYLGDMQKVKEIATRINTEKLYKQQACRNLGTMAEYGYPLTAEMQSLVNEFFCGGKQ